MVYYNKPMHIQKAFAGAESQKAGCKVSEELCRRVLSLPIDPYKTKEDIGQVSATVKDFLQGVGDFYDCQKNEAVQKRTKTI